MIISIKYKSLMICRNLHYYFQVETVGFTGEIKPLEKQMENDDEVWKEIASKYNLKENNLSKLASAWHTDLDLSRPMEIMTDMFKSMKLDSKFINLHLILLLRF